MITHLAIDGYKCLKNLCLSTTNLNVLVGPNASGKSSVLQSLLLLRQSANKEGDINRLHLSGPLYEAGTVLDVFHPEAEYRITISLNANDKNIDLIFYHDRDQATQVTQRLIYAQAGQQLPRSLYDRGNGFAYLNAERVGPRVTNPLPSDEHSLGGLVGMHGEYTTAILARAAAADARIESWNEILAKQFADAPEKLDARILEKDLMLTEGRLDSVCNLMLSWIIPGAVFQAAEQNQTDSASLRFIRDAQKTRTSVRATHIGFGLAYSLPIITAALALKSDGLLLVENPEAHLHPFSQSRIGVFLAMVAATGRQIFLETHSDHVINGIRLAISNGFVSHNHVGIHFFGCLDNGDTAKVTAISPKANGRLDKWPVGFFDQIENDLSKL